MSTDEFVHWVSNLDISPICEHEFTILPFQAKVECSGHCVRFVSFLVKEVTGCLHPQPPLNQLQDWVRRSLTAYAPLFTRVITAIPTELIPPESHIFNIDMKIEGRLRSIDFKKDEAIFKLDSTSRKKLEVFYEELIGREPGRELTDKLSALVLRMSMASAVGSELLGFHEVFGELFNIDGQHASVSHEEVEHAFDATENGTTTIIQEWIRVCNAIYKSQQQRHLPAQYDANPDGCRPLPAVIETLSDSGQLETFPKDGSTSPQIYWAPKPIRFVPKQQIIEGAVELSRGSQQDVSHSSPLQGRSSKAPFTSAKSSPPDFSRGTPKAYGDLQCKKHARVLRIPATPSLVSCADPPSPPIYTLPGPVTRSLSSNRETRKDSSNSSLLLMTNISTVADNGFVVSPDQDLTPPLCSRGSSTNSESNVTTPSNISPHSRLSIYDVFPTTLSPCSPMREDGAYPDDVHWKKRVKKKITDGWKSASQRERWMDSMRKFNSESLSAIDPPGDLGYDCHSQHLMADEAEGLDEYGFDFEDEFAFTPLQTKSEKQQDPTELIIQGRMEAMLDAAESEGYLYKATRDGVDNHPISVRLRTISGSNSSMKGIGDRSCSSASDGKITNSRVIGSTNDQNAILDSAQSPGDLYKATRDGLDNHPISVRMRSISQNNTDTGEQNPISTNNDNTSNTRAAGNQNVVSGLPSFPQMPIDTMGTIRGSYGTPEDQSRDKDFCEYKIGVKSGTECLRELKLKYEREAEQLLETYYRTQKWIQTIDTEIAKSEAQKRTLERQTREMIEFWGYDESAFTQETGLASPGGKSVDTSMEGFTTLKNLHDFIESGGQGGVDSNAAVVDSSQSKTDWKEPLKVRTKFCANSAESKEISPCCQFGIRPKGTQSEGQNVRCAHGIIRQVSNFSSTDISPTGLAEPWNMNYTVGRQRSRGKRANQEDCMECKANAPYGAYVGGERSYSGTPVTQTVGKWLPVAYSQSPTTFSQQCWVMSPSADITTTVTKNYSDKLTEYYQSTRGDVTQGDGKPSYKAINSTAKENFGAGCERKWLEPLEPRSYFQ